MATLWWYVHVHVQLVSSHLGKFYYASFSVYAPMALVVSFCLSVCNSVFLQWALKLQQYLQSRFLKYYLFSSYDMICSPMLL